MATASVRPGRSRALVVGVTGAAAGPGRALAARLAQRALPEAPEKVRKVVALDDRRGDVPGVTWRVVDIRDPLLSHRISDVDVIVHLDLELSPGTDRRVRRARNVSGAQSVLTAAAAARVGHVVMVTSAMVYDTGPGDPVPLREDAPPRAAAAPAADAGDSGVAGDFLEIERLAAAASAAHPEITVTVVRPAVLAGPGIDTAVTRHFTAPRLLGVRGAVQRWQFCHIDDLATALELVVLGPLTGALAVGCDGWIEADEAAEITGRRRLDLPAVVFGLAWRLHNAGLTSAPALELEHVVHPWAVDCAALRAAGWKPAYDNVSALRALVSDAAARRASAGPRTPSRKAVLATAGAAAAALVAATVVVRAARRRHR